MSELITQDQLQDVVVNGTEILKSAAVRVDKALTVGENILQVIKEQGMTQEVDERCNKFLVNCRNAKNEIEVQRKPITVFFDNVRKQFTETEGKLDPKKANSIPFQIQAHRDLYVKKLKKEEEERRAAAQAKMDKDNEAISIKTSIESQLSQHVQNHILARKQSLNRSFNAITLEDYASKSKALKALVISYEKTHFESFIPNLSPVPKYHNAEEIKALKVQFMATQDFDLVSVLVVDELKKFKTELIEKLTSLKTNLEEVAKADQEEKERLEKERLEREQKEEALLKEEADKAIAAQELEIDQKKVSEQTDAMMDNLTISETVTPETRDGYKIVILHQGAVVEIFNFWFQREGMNLTVEEIEKKTIAQMKAFCEKAAHKSDDKIISKYLRYESVYKAVNRK